MVKTNNKHDQKLDTQSGGIQGQKKHKKKAQQSPVNKTQKLAKSNDQKPTKDQVPLPEKGEITDQDQPRSHESTKSIFRKESMESIGSSQELRAYLRRSDRGLFLGIISLVLFIGGFWAWAVFSQIDTHVDALATVQDGNAYLYFTPDQAQAIQPGMSIFFKNTKATSVVDSVDTTIRQGVWPDVDQNGIPDFDWNSPYCEGFARALLPNGSYAVTIVVHSGSPIDFLFG